MQTIAALSLFKVQVQGYYNVLFSFIDGIVHDINKKRRKQKEMNNIRLS